MQQIDSDKQHLIVDRMGRRFRNLRLSLTAACNYACTYCVPDGKRLQAAAYELSGEEIVRATQLLIATAGIDKVRITGGEPLLSPKFPAILQGIMDLGLTDVSLTTNGQLLPRYARGIIDSGMQRINVSLDTLNRERFREIARSGDLNTVLHGIELMQAGGLKVKINMVPMHGVNDDQILPLLEYALERNIELRFIELMNMGHLQASPAYAQEFFSMEQILDRIGKQYTFSRTDAPFDSTAVRYEIPGSGTFGIIANESEPFCRNCTRLRLSSNGALYGCLSSARSTNIRQLLALPDAEAQVELHQVLLGALADKQSENFQGEVTVMKFIGG
ncbi:MAG: GTP 3',8-cyclase MoaA [Proteobacteria bacterium]|nr:GTP 3',8-cyclase MoaA [Pseudomonadota bacterium]